MITWNLQSLGRKWWQVLLQFSGYRIQLFSSWENPVPEFSFIYNCRTFFRIYFSSFPTNFNEHSNSGPKKCSALLEITNEKTPTVIGVGGPQPPLRPRGSTHTGAGMRPGVRGRMYSSCQETALHSVWVEHEGLLGVGISKHKLWPTYWEKRADYYVKEEIKSWFPFGGKYSDKKIMNIKLEY